MDPTANLLEQLMLARRLEEMEDNEDFRDEHIQCAERLAELVLALHEWIQKGGFLPAQWKR